MTLAIGLFRLPSQSEQIGDPYFAALEVLILFMMPLLVTLMAAVHAGAPLRAKAFTLTSLIFTGLLTGLTMGVHFVVLVVSRQAAFTQLVWLPMLISFKWPSIAYVLDILAWDVFFALAVLFAQEAFQGGRVAAWIRLLMIASGVLALAGLSGVAVGDMRLRNIGIIGYAGAFPVAAGLLALLFWKAKPERSLVKCES